VESKRRIFQDGEIMEKTAERGEKANKNTRIKKKKNPELLFIDGKKTPINWGGGEFQGTCAVIARQGGRKKRACLLHTRKMASIRESFLGAREHG